MQKKTQKTRPFLTTGEIVRIAKVHPGTVAMWRATGKIVPKDKIGSSFLYDRNEVMAFLKERERKKKERLQKK
jgi:hypothetical protein